MSKVSNTIIDTNPNHDPILGMHYVLAGYVRRGEIVTSSPLVGVRNTFEIIYAGLGRPKDARFAVAQACALKEPFEPFGPWVVWDLEDHELVRGQRTAPSGLRMPPPPLWMGPTADAMLMKALNFMDFMA